MNNIQSNLNRLPGRTTLGRSRFDRGLRWPARQAGCQPERQPSTRRGFTLVELLLVIAIMAVLTTMGLAVMRSSVEDAKAAATQTTITKIESMLLMQMEQYEVRRLPVSREMLNNLVPASDPERLIKIRNFKHRLIANILCAEMPRPFPIGTDPATGDPIYKPKSNCNGVRSDLNLGIFPVDKVIEPLLQPAAWKQITPAGVNRWNSIAAKMGDQPTRQIPGEYLYEILKGIDYDGINGLESLGARAIGDSDGNGVPEIVDAWGDPLNYKIEQIRAKKVFKKEIWVDEDFVDPLNTLTPRSIDKISVTVTSKNLAN